MKRRLFVLVGVFGATAIAHAGGNQPDAGCGMGSVWFPENKPAPQLVAMTTNASYSQAFGITSGTSGCTSGGLVKASVERKMFVATNFRALTMEMAAGQGEYMTSLAALSGCKSKEFSAFAKTNYEKLLPSEKTSATELLRNLDRELVSDPSMVKACGI